MGGRLGSTYFLPRDLHPAAWWIWALGLAVAASRTTNPWILATIIAVACHVVVSRRSAAPWALAFRLYLVLAGIIIALRVLFRLIFGGGEGSTIVLSLPEIPLPQWAAGIRLLGDVSAESLLGGFYDGLRLATMIICLGAANALANPKRLLKMLPPALYEIGTAVIVAMSVFPQLAESVLRVRRARALRGHTGKGIARLRSVVIPVLEDALERSLTLAASMDSRGYGRAGVADTRRRALTGTLMIVGLVGVCVGVYGSMDSTAPVWFGVPMLLAGTALALVGFQLTGKHVRRTRYRPDRWQVAEVVVASSGVAAAVSLVLTGQFAPTTLAPSLIDLSWPILAWPTLLGVLIAVAPSFLTPRPPEPFEDAWTYGIGYRERIVDEEAGLT
ncbi:energy-coupling factor transporter transmembrane protein EcfT [Aeromicrobium sp. YIM 150415]|nr:energy-coupling factor transporter transmembrane protein EcfT [Aeromicrobium sp. YIM 150415]